MAGENLIVFSIRQCFLSEQTLSVFMAFIRMSAVEGAAGGSVVMEVDMVGDIMR